MGGAVDLLLILRARCEHKPKRKTGNVIISHSKIMPNSPNLHKSQHY